METIKKHYTPEEWKEHELDAKELLTMFKRQAYRDHRI